MIGADDYDREALELSEKQAQPKAKRQRPPLRVAPVEGREDIKIGTDVYRMADELVDRLARTTDLDVFQHCGDIVRVRRVTVEEHERDDRKVVDTPLIEAAPYATLNEWSSLVARWMRLDTRHDPPAWKPALPQKDAVAAVHARTEYRGIRTLLGIAEAPLMRRDGEIVQTPGYDATSCYLYEPNARFLDVPAMPSQQDAQAALAILKRPFRGFPFEGGPDGPCAMVPIAMIMSLLSRPCSLAVPAFLFSSNSPRSGKSKCVDAVSLVVSGRPAPRGEYAESSSMYRGVETLRPDVAEIRKEIGALADCGPAMVLFDDIKSYFGSAAIDMALTATDKLLSRELGKSIVRVREWRTIMAATGVNLRVETDHTGPRCLKCTINVDCADPERRVFDFDLFEEIARDRGDLVRAALVILRAYHVAGRPEMDQRLGGFEEWAELVAGALLWAGGVNVLDAQPRKDDTSDPIRQNRRIVLELLPKALEVHNARNQARKLALTPKAIAKTLWPNGARLGSDHGLDPLCEALEWLTSQKAPGGPAITAALAQFKGKYERIELEPATDATAAVMAERCLTIGAYDSHEKSDTWMVAERPS